MIRVLMSYSMNHGVNLTINYNTSGVLVVIMGKSVKDVSTSIPVSQRNDLSLS